MPAGECAAFSIPFPSEGINISRRHGRVTARFRVDYSAFDGLSTGFGADRLRPMVQAARFQSNRT
jgi:hypothetical protein